MSKITWQSVGTFDTYHYIADALWLHDSWTILYMTADLKVIRCDEGYFNILVGQEHSHLYVTNGKRLMRQEIIINFGKNVWQEISKEISR